MNGRKRIRRQNKTEQSNDILINTEKERNNIIPLTLISEGEKVRIASIRGGRHCKERLLNLGIIPGKEIDVISGHRNHPFILKVNDVKVMIGCGMVRKIYVTQD